MLTHQQTASENTASLKMIKAPEIARDVSCKESQESHRILKNINNVSSNNSISDLFYRNSVPSCVPFLLKINEDHRTDCNLCKLHVCLQLYFTYSIYHLQTIP